MDSGPTLESVCSEFVDCVNRTAPETFNGNYYAIGTPAMRGNTINLQEARRLSAETFNRWTRRLVPIEGDLLIAREAPVGPVVRIPAGDCYAAGQRTTHLRADPSVIDGRYLYYLLISPEVQARLLAQAMGSTVPHLRVADLRAFKLPQLPPLPQQIAIGEILGSLDDKIAANTTILETVRELLVAEFENLGIDPGTECAGRDGTVADLAHINPRETLDPAKDAAFLEMKNLPDAAMTVSKWTRRVPRGGAKFRNGDTLLARITPCLENGKAGLVDFLGDGEVGHGSTEFIVMRPRDGVAKSVPWLLSKSSRFREFAIKHMMGTSGRQRLSASDVGKYPVSIPTCADMEAFSQFSNRLLDVVRACVIETRSLAHTRDLLLPLLMSGKVTVNSDEELVGDVTDALQPK